MLQPRAARPETPMTSFHHRTSGDSVSVWIDGASLMRLQSDYKSDFLALKDTSASKQI